MNKLLRKLNMSSKKLGVISTIAMLLGIALLALSLWGFIKGSHISMSRRNGSAWTLFFVSVKWVNLVLGGVLSAGGFVLLRKSESYVLDDSKDEQQEDETDDPDIPDFPDNI